AEIYNRKAEVERFYTTQNWEEAKAILKKYNIRYVTYITPECEDKKALIGPMERGVFRQRLQPVLSGAGRVGSRSGLFELYEVPESF
ncbi:MAG: hypothetical protein ACP5I1_16205, partial [Candidatus Hinthialibacter sp.]